MRFPLLLWGIRGGHARSRLIGLVLVAGIGAAVYFGVARGLISAGAPSARNPAPAIPVTASKAMSADFPVELTGLGTVRGLNSVLVRSRAAVGADAA